MKQFKIIAAVAGLIGIGFIAGFLTNREITRHRIERLSEMTAPAGFQRHLLDFIHADPQQREQLLPIVEKYGKQMHEITRESREERRAMIDAMHEEIKPYLTQQQLEQLEKFGRRVKGRKRRNKD